MRKLLLSLAFLAAVASSADAGIFRNRKQSNCSSGTCSAVASPNGAGVTTTACANGKCELPSAAAPSTIVIDGKRYTLVPTK